MDQSGCVPTQKSSISRRDLFKLTLRGGSGLALGGLLDVRAMRAATEDLKLSNVSEFTTSCNFCSCGCGMVAAVRDGKLITLEGDSDHVAVLRQQFFDRTQEQCVVVCEQDSWARHKG